MNRVPVREGQEQNGATLMARLNPPTDRVLEWLRGAPALDIFTVEPSYLPAPPPEYALQIVFENGPEA